MKYKLENLSFKIACAFLIYKGEITRSEIKSIPFLSKPEESDVIIQKLISHYNVEIINKKISSFPFLEWEEIIKLKKIIVHKY